MQIYARKMKDNHDFGKIKKRIAINSSNIKPKSIIHRSIITNSANRASSINHNSANNQNKATKATFYS